MSCILGIDLGTSSVKAMILDVETGEVCVESCGYGVQIPAAGQAQQDPGLWWESTCGILAALSRKYPAAFDNIRAVGLSGQMHGLVMADAQGRVTRPAIIWLDQRSAAECETIQSEMKKHDWDRMLQNQVFPGFALPSLLWVRNREPSIYKQTDRIMQPKDYIRYRLTGEMGTDVTDASASLMCDIGKRQWAYPVLEALGIDSRILPDCHESMEIAGVITDRAHEQTGLKAGIPVIFGAGDQQCQSVGNGVITPGQVVCNIGTGGQVSVCSGENCYDSRLRTHTFCHCFGQAYTVFGAVLCAGEALQWLRDRVVHEESFAALSEKAGQITPGSGGALFLPYLAGERTPHMNDRATGMFFGLKLAQDERHLARAVMEGVTFALKDSLLLVREVVRGEDSGDGKLLEEGVMIASGGACASPVWLQMQADIFRQQVRVSRIREQACLGACILAGVGTGILSGLEQACRTYVAYEDKVYDPDEKYTDCYENMYRKFHGLYEKVKEFY